MENRLREGCTESCRAMRELQGDVRGKLQSECGARRDGGQRAEWEHAAGAIIHADNRFFTSRCSSSRIVFTMPVASLLEHYALFSKRGVRGLRETQEGERLGGGKSAR